VNAGGAKIDVLDYRNVGADKKPLPTDSAQTLDNLTSVLDTIAAVREDLASTRPSSEESAPTQGEQEASKPKYPQPGDRRYNPDAEADEVWAPTRYNLRTWFSHHTDGFGAGPGWDSLLGYYEDPEAAKAIYGHVITYEEYRDPRLLPELPVYGWVLDEPHEGEANGN